MKFRYGSESIDNIYEEECKYIDSYQARGEQRCTYVPKPISYNLNGKYVSIIQTLFLQLSSQHIYDSMHLLKVTINKSNFIKWDCVMKFKLQRDGFQYNLKSRRNMLITLTNCSVWNVGNSRNCCSIIALIDSDEDRWTLSLVSQRLDIELMWLNIIGFVCLRTGRNVGIIAFNVEDTGSLEKTFGKDVASGRYRWHLSKFNAQTHHHQWFTAHVPISVDVRLAETTWRNFENNILDPYITNSNKIDLKSSDLFLCEFSKSTSNPIVYKNNSLFKKIQDKINRWKIKNHGFVGNWHGAKSIWTFGTDGLHLALRIANHTIKRLIIFTIDYSHFLKKNTDFIKQNHRRCKKYKILSTDQIIRHFRDCCKIPFHFDSKHPNRLRITSGLVPTTCIFCYIYIYFCQQHVFFVIYIYIFLCAICCFRGY